jgi:hypothetical protein
MQSPASVINDRRILPMIQGVVVEYTGSAAPCVEEDENELDIVD